MQPEVIEHAIRSHYTDPQFTVSLLAERLSLSVSYLREVTYRHFQMGPHRLIETVRLEAAIPLLADGGRKLYVVREQVGYARAKTFREAVQKRLQVPPSVCRNRLIDSDDMSAEIERFLQLLWKNGRER